MVLIGCGTLPTSRYQILFRYPDVPLAVTPRPPPGAELSVVPNPVPAGAVATVRAVGCTGPTVGVTVSGPTLVQSIILLLDRGVTVGRFTVPEEAAGTTLTVEGLCGDLGLERQDFDYTPVTLVVLPRPVPEVVPPSVPSIGPGTVPPSPSSTGSTGVGVAVAVAAPPTFTG